MAPLKPPGDREAVSSEHPLTRPSVLYHYCSAETFKAITANRCIWLSDAAHMNDATEGRWIDEIVARLRSVEQEWVQWCEAGHIWHDYKLFKASFYIACFSEQGDLLSQWRAYADDGRGVSIGFDFGELSLPTGLTFTEVFHMNALGSALDRVVYEEEAQMEAVRRVFRYIDRWARSEAALNSYFREAVVDTGRDCLGYLSRLLKHPGFQEEREWRIVYDGRSDRKAMGIDPAPRRRLRGETEIAYFELGFRAAAQPIRRVLLGPKCPLSVEEVSELLANAGYQGAEVKRSVVPYR